MERSFLPEKLQRRLQRIRALLKKEFGQIFKDKRMLPLIFVAPVLQLAFLGYAASLDVKNISFVLCDLDKTEQSREFIQSFTNSGYFSMLYSTEEYQSIERYLDNNNVSMALVIPHNFGNKIIKHESAHVQILMDGSEGNTTAIIMSYANQIIAKYSAEKMASLGGDIKKLGGMNLESRAWYNPTLVSRKFMVPGVLVLILLLTTMNLTAMAIVKEKEIGTLEQLLVTPLRPAEMILGKLVPFIIIGFVNVTVVTLVMVYGFDIPIRGSVILLFTIAGFFLLTTLGLGLLISTLSDTQQQAMMVGTFGLMSPMMYLSGFVFPVENMPDVLQYVSYGIPMRYFLVVVRSIILKGSTLNELWFEASMLLGMGIVILAASIFRFREKMD
ncbi:MAG: ABC transporter permease [Bacteroidetes bacterium]|nr:ABC transporter permease [Bacteroidota bacterium]